MRVVNGECIVVRAGRWLAVWKWSAAGADRPPVSDKPDQGHGLARRWQRSGKTCIQGRAKQAHPWAWIS